MRLERLIRRLRHSCLLDYPGRLQQDLGRERKAELLGRLQVDDEVKLRWLLYVKVARVRTLEDLVYVIGGTAAYVKIVRPVGHEPTSLHKNNLSVHRRQPSLGSELNELCSTTTHEPGC